MLWMSQERGIDNQRSSMQGRVTDLALLPQLLMILVPTANLDLYNVAQASPALELKLTYRQCLTVICQTADRLLYLLWGVLGNAVRSVQD